MFKRLVIFAAIFTTQLNTSRAYDYPDQLKLVTSASSASRPLPAATQVAQDLLDGIGTWLVSNFELPAVQDRPVIEFVPKTRLAAMRLQGHSPSEGANDARYNEPVSAGPTVQKRSSFRMIGLDNQLRINRSWFMRWFITSKILQGLSMNVQGRERNRPTWLR
jgi:hypothetical protein